MIGIMTVIKRGFIDYKMKILAAGELCGMGFEILGLGQGKELLNLKPENA